MVYVDDLFFWPGKRKTWSHMWADSTSELHRMAEIIGVKKCWFENRRGRNFPHYDIHEDKRKEAIKYGAIEMHLRDYLIKRKKNEQ